ncbi:MAG: GNAT family N-acetyltransferase [Dehalococcoidia bacterium]|nr:MAG: GNAT family N-acetyltransferase [Dehalococcoidia bacterium]
MRYFSRAYRGLSDLPSGIELKQAITRARLPTYYHPGDFVWQLYAFDETDDVRLWFDGEMAIACAIFEPPLTFQFAVHPDADAQRGLETEILDWVEHRRMLVGAHPEIPLAYQQLGDDALATNTLASDVDRAEMLRRNGFTRHGPAGIRYACALDGALPEVELPEGAAFRELTDEDVEARAELHREAWSVWGPSDHHTERYRRLRRAPLYRSDLDVVLEFEGRLVSYCVCWLDVVNRVGHFEPVGTHHAFVRRGFGRAVVREGMRRLRERGMQTATVGTASVNLAAQRLYASAGFEVVDTEDWYRKTSAGLA